MESFRGSPQSLHANAEIIPLPSKSFPVKNSSHFQTLYILDSDIVVKKSTYTLARECKQKEENNEMW
jgi:hypothetical protein